MNANTAIGFSQAWETKKITKEDIRIKGKSISCFLSTIRKSYKTSLDDLVPSRYAMLIISFSCLDHMIAVSALSPTIESINYRSI